MEGASQQMKGVGDPICLCETGLCEIRVAKFNSVGKQKRFGLSIDNMKTSVVLEGRTDVEAVAAAEVPRFAGAGFVVDKNFAPSGADGSGIIVEGSIEVSPCGFGRIEHGLA